jgi:secreted trypsin-like serine protease
MVELQAAENQFPHQVTYRIASDNSLFCGGFVINERWTGTSVRCINFRNLHFSNFIVVMGSNRLSGGTVYRISKVVDHPDYRVSKAEN